jgi:DNA-binding NarL/FixJ family response regulator
MALNELDEGISRWPHAANSLQRRLGALQTALQAAHRELEAARSDYQLLAQATKEASMPSLDVAVALPLTPAEQRVAALAAVGLRDAEIASALCLSVNTIRTHMKSVLRKLNMHSRWQLLNEPPRRNHPLSELPRNGDDIP